MRFARLVAAIALISFSILGASQPATAPEDGKVFIIPIKGEIERGLAYFVRRSIATVEREDAAALVLHMDTHGGELMATEDIMEALLQSPLETYTFVDVKAISAGALIAISTKHIFMAPASKIGAATPISVAPGGGAADMPDAVQEKITSYVRTLARAAAEKNGHRKDVVEAMVDRDIEIRGVTKKGKLLTLTNEEAAGKKVKLSEGTVDSLEAMLQQAGLAAHERVLLEITWSERVARFLTQSGLRGLLLMAGLLGIYLELKTPGFGVPGAVGLFFLALFFFGQYVAGLAGWEDMLLFTIGALLLAAEAFLIPGFGIAGIAGIACLLASFYMSMTKFHRPIQAPPWWEFPQATGAFYTVSAAVIGSGLAAFLIFKYILPHTPLWEGGLALTSTEARNAGFVSSAVSYKDYVGQTGTATTQLRPSGKASFGEVTLDVVTEGDMIPAGSAVRVISVDGHRIVVAAAQEPGDGSKV